MFPSLHNVKRHIPQSVYAVRSINEYVRKFNEINVQRIEAFLHAVDIKGLLFSSKVKSLYKRFITFLVSIVKNLTIQRNFNAFFHAFDINPDILISLSACITLELFILDIYFI